MRNLIGTASNSYGSSTWPGSYSWKSGGAFMHEFVYDLSPSYVKIKQGPLIWEQVFKGLLEHYS